MATLNDFKDLFNEVGIEENEYEHASNLVHSLRNYGKCGLFSTLVANGKNSGWIISCDGVDDMLHQITMDVDVDVEFDYDNYTKEARPYPVYTIRRIWKGVPLSQVASFKDDKEMQVAIESQKIGEEL